VETDPEDLENHIRYLYHGQTLHGFQFMGSDHYRKIITTYFTEKSGIARAITNHPRYSERNPHGEQMRVGVVGLGAGTLAAYGKEGDYYRIYEINPAMAEVAASEKGYFRFVPDSKAEVDVIMGDARISMENEEPQQFDVLALDAFSGDAPPVHLLTREAFSLYMKHIREGGIIAVHITNRYLNFKPLIWNIAKEMDLERVLITSWGDDWITYYTDWFLLAKDKGVLQQNVFTADAIPEPDPETLKSTTIWSDDYSNLYQLLY
ncbi:spermidine synthase, partial [Thermodesulfobacteriota bacterium]